MTTLTMEMPEKVFTAMRVNPEEFTVEMRLAAAVSWYELRIPLNPATDSMGNRPAVPRQSGHLFQ